MGTPRFHRRHPVGKSIRSSTRRRIRQRREEDECEDHDFDTAEWSSARSPASSSCNSSVSSPAGPVTIVRAKSKSVESHQLSVRRGVAGFSAYAVQDAGTYQMLHDECSYLCSTILSKKIHPSKAINAAIELATMLSSRKTRSILWQGGSSDNQEDQWDEDSSKPGSTETQRTKSYFHPQSPVKNPKKLSPVPKIWSSIFEVISMTAPTGGTLHGVSSSHSSIASSAAASSSSRVERGLFSRKSRTKSARRKEKALSQGGGCAVGTLGQTSSVASNHRSVSSTACKRTCEMKEVLAYIAYCVSWDCTMSGEHSVAAMGSVNSSSLARKIRMAILERGAILTGIMNLMTTSLSPPPPPAVTTAIGSGLNIDLPVSPLRTATSPTRKRPLTRSSSMSSSFTALDFTPANDTSSFPAKETELSSSKTGGDPTAMGRRNRKKRRRQRMESSSNPLLPPPSQSVNMSSIPEQLDLSEECKDARMMPPPRRKSRRLNAGKSDELSFADVSVRNEPARESGDKVEDHDDASSILSEAATEGTSVFANRIAQKVNELRASVLIESSPSSTICRGTTTNETSTIVEDAKESFDTDRNCQWSSTFFPPGDHPWLSIVCLEAMTRILTGKELNGKTSCLEGEVTTANEDDGAGEDENDSADDENSNVLLVTNRLVGKSGIIPLLASAMSQTMIAATKFVFAKTQCNVRNLNGDSNNVMDKEHAWQYCHNRLKLLATLIDEACFFSEKNRRSFCEEDPFSFEDGKKGLIVHILTFLDQCCKCDLSQFNQPRSETMSLALRTLTSLTHDNPLAAEQMKTPSDSCVEGIRVLANLVFHLEKKTSSNSTNLKKVSSRITKKATDHDMHRYDGTIFCLTTLANVIEGSGIRRGLMKIEIRLQSGVSLSWLTWLCKWVVEQTELFQDELLSIGSKNKRSNSSDVINSTGSAFAVDQDKELQKHEEDKLIAAGNGCVVLACLMTEADDDDSECSSVIRKLVEEEMPFDPERNSSPLALVMNTMKAYCNYYHMSMGQMSFAVVAPVKKLINDLEEVIEFDKSKSIA